MSEKNWTRMAAFTLTAAMVWQLSCGYILYPERRNQGPTGRIDPAVLLMDAFWVLVFIVPGVAAFVVDITTGAIYLPGDIDLIDRERPLKEPATVDAGATITLRAAEEAPTRTIGFSLLAEDEAPRNLGSWRTDRDYQLQVPANLAPGDYRLQTEMNGEPAGAVALRIQ